MRIGWIGAGIMGQPMVCHLLEHKQEVYVYARHPEKVRDCISKGAVLEPSIEDLVSKADVICTMVGFPDDVKEVYRKIFSVIEKGKTCIDFTTSSPQLAQTLFQQAEKLGVHILDAPVTGGDVGAKAGTLTILVGGQKAVFDSMMPVFRSFGSQIEYCGASGMDNMLKWPIRL